MTEVLFKKILEEIRTLHKRIDNLEELIRGLKIPEVAPTPEEEEIIQEYLKEKAEGKLALKKMF